GQPKAQAPRDEMGKFVAAVLGETEDRWKDILEHAGQTYRAPKLVLFTRKTKSACGKAKAASGPFYCPDDERIYLDTAFFREIEEKFHGCEAKACQFAQALIIAHEVGHHIQKLLGIMEKSQQMQAGPRHPAAGQHIPGQVELQADCFAGVWANRAQEKWKFIEPGDLDAALNTIQATGDDTLQKLELGEVMPDTFTHGSGEQRKRWFLRGFKSGNMADCNTFDATE